MKIKLLKIKKQELLAFCCCFALLFWLHKQQEMFLVILELTSAISAVSSNGDIINFKPLL